MKYERIRRLETEGLSASLPVSTTGLGLRNYFYEIPRDPGFPIEIDAVESIALLRSRILLHIQPEFKIQDLSDSPRMLRLLDVARNESCKEKIFSTVWGISPYHPLRHGNVIHQLVHRMKSELGVEFVSDKSTLTLKNCWVIQA